MVEGEGFEPSKAEPTDLQSVPFGHSGTPPKIAVYSLQTRFACQHLTHEMPRFFRTGQFRKQNLQTK